MTDSRMVAHGSPIQPSRPSQVAAEIVAAGADYCLVTAAQAAQGFLSAIDAALNDDLARFTAAQSEAHRSWAERTEILG
ncbi:MAG TPA: hypothetical protein VKP30_23020 [Polyangiaceae bacterium]|nr:hypothetical protein [Polyangiaceae bacterium]